MQSRQVHDVTTHVGMMVAVKNELRLLSVPPRDAYILLEMYPEILLHRRGQPRGFCGGKALLTRQRMSNTRS